MRLLTLLMLLVALVGCESSRIVEICDNDIDDDFDELVDCEDYESCSLDPACMAEAVCDDDLDNDGNGLTDCEDPHCFDADACLDAGASR